jgi:hypothetical protein
LYCSIVNNCIPAYPLQKAIEARLAERAKFGDNLALIACGHGVILDYIIGLNPESVKDVIAYLESRYACRPPRIIINDNACQVERSGKPVRMPHDSRLVYSCCRVCEV